MSNAAWVFLTLAAAAVWCRLGQAQPCACVCQHCRCVNQSAPNATDSESCLNGSAPCLTLNYALLTDLRNDTCILLSSGPQTYNDSSPMAVSDVNSIAISGEGQGETIVTCEGGSGLAFINVTNLTIAKLSFVNCEAERNSTTYYDDNDTPEVFLVGIYCWLCVDVTLDYLKVSNSSGVGVVFYETGGNNTIKHSVFSHNRFSNDSDFKGGGGGVTVEYPFCPPGTEKKNCSETVSNNNENSSFEFFNCTFEDNYSFLKNPSEYTFIAPGATSHIAFGRGGGLTLYFRGKAQLNQVTIKSCTFARNTALFGGGLLSEFQGNATNNTVIVGLSQFLNNTCPYKPYVGTSGGGVRVGFTFISSNSTIQAPSNIFFMETVTFIGNKAYVGGGLSFITGRQQRRSESESLYNDFFLGNCTWINNTARLGAAVDVTKWGNVADGYVPTVVMVDCTFRQNSIHYLEKHQIGIVGCGVVYADSVPITFAGSTQFIDNLGSGIAVRSSYVSFASGHALFQHNMARDGGGIAIYGDAWIEVHPNFALLFRENRAYYRGGAIFYEDVGNRNLLSSRRCFIQYSDTSVTRQNWNASFEFVNNTARENGHSIFCTSLIPCVWGGVSGSGSVSQAAIKKTFNWGENIFSYKCSEENCTNEIASGPSSANLAEPAAKNDSGEYFVFSGKQAPLPFIASDDLGLQVHAPFSITAHGEALSIQSNVATGHYAVNGCPNNKSTLTFFSIEELPLRVKVDVSISECPPGFLQTGPNCTCACPPPNDYIAACHISNMTAMIYQGRWMGCLNDSTPLRVNSNYFYSYCASKFCNTLQPYQMVPLFNNTGRTCKDLNDHICNYTGQKRAGLLCSDCREGYGLSLTSRDYQCVQCPEDPGHKAAAFFILLSVEILPMLLFILIIIMFDINILAAPIYSFVFLCQVKHTLLPRQPYEIDRAYTYLSMGDSFFSGLLNLQFFGLFISEGTCISQNLKVLDILLIRYAILFLPIVVIVFVLAIVKAYASGYCCGLVQSVVGAFVRCMNRLKGKSTANEGVLHGLCGFLVLAYADMVRISTDILNPAHLFDASGKPLSGGARVQVQGAVHMFDSQHRPYALVAIIVLAVFVALPCFLLLTRPLLPQFLVFCRLGDKRPFKWIVAFYGSNRLKPIFDCFQGSFRDNMGFFAGLFLLYRIAFLLVFVNSEKLPTHLLLAKLFLIFLIFFLHSCFQPYREDKKFVNKVDSFMFLVMGALVAIVYFNHVENSYNKPGDESRFWVQLVIQYLPYVYLLFLAFWYTRDSIRRRLQQCSLVCYKKIPLLRNVEMEESLDGSYGAFDQGREGVLQAREWLNDDNEQA